MKLTRRGFSLIETMLSVSILLIVIIAAVLAIVSSTFLVESSRNLVTASNYAQYVLEEIKTQSFGDIQNFISNYGLEKFSNNPLPVHISFPSAVYTSNLDTITVQISWNERNAEKTFSITTCFTQ